MLSSCPSLWPRKDRGIVGSYNTACRLICGTTLLGTTCLPSNNWGLILIDIHVGRHIFLKEAIGAYISRWWVNIIIVKGDFSLLWKHHPSDFVSVGRFVKRKIISKFPAVKLIWNRAGLHGWSYFEWSFLLLTAKAAEGNLKHPGHLETTGRVKVRRTQGTLSIFQNLFQTSMWHLSNPEEKNIWVLWQKLLLDLTFWEKAFWLICFYLLRKMSLGGTKWKENMRWQYFFSAEKNFFGKSAWDEVECRKSCHVCLS